VRRAAAKKGDQILAMDTHVVFVPVGSALVAKQLPHVFTGIINDDRSLSPDVNIMGMPAATVDSTAENQPHHSLRPPEQGFENPPTNLATIIQGSQTVKINRKAAARDGDTAETCNDPKPAPVGKVVAVGTVLIG
jgi:uncharacterized Zn-binding protein involved in type VI secretion